MTEKAKIKVDLITGFLGAGKTTFIKKYGMYLKKQNIKFTVIENEYGGEGIDSRILADIGITAEELAGGCMCCTLKVGFHNMLINLSDKDFERIIVEPSGIYEVSQFFAVMSNDIIKESYEIGAVIAVTDPEQVRLYNREEYILLKHQLQYTDGIILSKVQNLSENELIDCIDKIAMIAPAVPVLYDGNWENMIDCFFDGIINMKSVVHICTADRNHSDIFRSFTVFPEKTYDEKELEYIIKTIISGKYGSVMRVKGFVYGKDCGYTVDVGGGTAAINKVCNTYTPQVNIIGTYIKEKELICCFK